MMLHWISFDIGLFDKVWLDCGFIYTPLKASFHHSAFEELHESDKMPTTGKSSWKSRASED